MTLGMGRTNWRDVREAKLPGLIEYREKTRYFQDFYYGHLDEVMPFIVM